MHQDAQEGIHGFVEWQRQRHIRVSTYHQLQTPGLTASLNRENESEFTREKVMKMIGYLEVDSPLDFTPNELAHFLILAQTVVEVSRLHLDP